MIITLQGKITDQQAGWVILETEEGVGYQIFTKQPAGNQNNKSKKFFIYHHIKEDKQELYGFKTIEERQFFIQLISVSGVGPKMAMTIMKAGDISILSRSIQEGNTALLTTVSGVGKKLASKIIVELKNKIGGPDDNYLPSEADQDLVGALKNLGYASDEIVRLLGRIPENLKTTEEKLKWILKNLKVIHN